MNKKSSLLEKYSKEISLSDSTNREGLAAKVYFNRMFGNGFARGDDDPINQALNYGYMVLLSYFNREIVASGYITQMGINHKNIFNDFNLSCDLMEPFRPLVDKAVLSFDNNVDLNSEKKTQLVDIFNQFVLYDEKKQTVSNCISLYCYNCFDFLRNNTEHIKIFTIE